MIYPYKMGSQSAKNLAAAMGIKQIKREGSKFKGSAKKVVINWGSSTLTEEINKCVVLNTEKAVALAGNKLSFFNLAQGKVSIPEFTTDKQVAQTWLNEGTTVFGRTTLTGHSGAGIYELESNSNILDMNLSSVKVYVKYIPKKEEYRVHVVDGKVIDVRRKALRADFNKETANWKIRNHNGGFIFAKDGFQAPEQVLEESLKAVECVGLVFGAVDVVWNNFRNQAYVLEVNTAPGLEGSSLDNYSKAFGDILKDELRVALIQEKNKKSLVNKKSYPFVTIDFEDMEATPVGIVGEF